MDFRKALESDAPGIMEIIRQAQEYFREKGIDQWQNGYPNLKTIRNDISKGNSYVLVKDQAIVGTLALIFDGEKTYDRIYEGKWLSSGSYAVIHRIAVDAQYKGLGLASEMIKKVEQMCLQRNVHSIKVDTHEENRSMQRLLQKNGFQYCGIIYLEDRSKRLAFEKIL